MYRFTVCVAAALFALASEPSYAQQYPTKPIRILVGPGPDALARVYGQKFTEAWGQQVVIDQRPGAGGTIAAETVAKGIADGGAVPAALAVGATRERASAPN